MSTQSPEAASSSSTASEAFSMFSLDAMSSSIIVTTNDGSRLPEDDDAAGGSAGEDEDAITSCGRRVDWDVGVGTPGLILLQRILCLSLFKEPSRGGSQRPQVKM